AAVPRNVTLVDGRTLVVQVQSNAGQGVPSATVSAEARVPVLGSVLGSAAWHRMRMEATTARDGSVRIGPLPDGLLAVEARAPGHVAASAFPVDPRQQG